MTDTITLTVPAGRRGLGIIALVLGGLGSRLELPVDRVDELTLAAEAAGVAAKGETIEFEMNVLEDRLVLLVGPLGEGAATEESLRRVVKPLVDRVDVVRKHDAQEWLELEVARGRSDNARG